MNPKKFIAPKDLPSNFRWRRLSYFLAISFICAVIGMLDSDWSESTKIVHPCLSEPYFFKFDTKGWYIHSHALVTVQATVRGYPLVFLESIF